MTIEMLSRVMMWGMVLNYGILLLWFMVFVLAHDWLYRLHGKWFQLSPGQFDVIHYGGMATYKIGIMLFNLVPYIALRIVG